MKRINMTELKTAAGITVGQEHEDEERTVIHSGRQKLKTSLNFKKLLDSHEGEFEVDTAAPTSQSLPKKPKKFLDNCNFKNIMVEAITDDNSEILMFSDFSTLSRSMENVTEDGKLKKKIDKAGQKGKIPPLNAKVWINYTAIIENWDEPVDKTDKNGKPKAFRIGRGEVLPVLDIGVPTMELKEVAKFLAAPDYAYGKLGLPDRVPPDATVLFTVELVDYMESTPVSSIFKMNPEERAEIGFKEVEKAAIEMKTEGNRLCKTSDWASAITKYRRGVKILDRYVTADRNIEKRRNDLLFVLYTNLAQCYLVAEEYEKVLDSCQLALDLPPDTEGNKCKAYYRQAKAQFHLGRFEEAKALVKEALKLRPSDVDVRTFYEELCKRVEHDEEVAKALSKKMMAGLNVK